MKKPKIAIGADHRGFLLKEFLMKQSCEFVKWIDSGAFTDENSNYPVFAHAVCNKILQGEADYGILLCGTGAGMAMAANRKPGIYAAVAWEGIIARRVRQEDFCNVLVLPADYLDETRVVEIFDEWRRAHPKNSERYAVRRAMIDDEKMGI